VLLLAGALIKLSVPGGELDELGLSALLRVVLEVVAPWGKEKVKDDCLSSKFSF
jgi:hypothetical protein